MPATKQDIADLFWRHVEHYGFAKTSVEGVARELGISKTTVYQYFSGKDEILRYVIEGVATSEADRVESEYAALPTYWARIEKLIREVAMQATRDWLDRYQQTEARHQFEFGAQVFGEVFDTLVQRWLAEGEAAGEFNLIQGDVLITARCVGSIIQFGIARTRLDRERQVDDAIVEAARKLVA